MDGLSILAAAVLLGAGVGAGMLLRRQSVAAAVAAADLAAEARRGAELAREVEVLRGRLEAAQAEARRLGEERTRLAGALEAERRAGADRAAEAERTKESVRAEIEKLAGRVLEQQGKTLVDRSREGLEALLRPLGEKLKEFEQKVERTHETDVRERASLGQHLQALQEAQARLHEDAEALSRALTRDSKQQGDWGEIVLERVLEAAGLGRGRDYDVQVSHVDDEGGRKRPDALVYLPDDRAIVVDAKCSLTAFVEAARAADDAGRERALDAHVASLRAHVKGLAGKRYTEVLRQRSLEFVMMFVPSEAAYLAGLSREPSLWEEAFRQGVVLTSPTTLVAAMRLVAQIWRTNDQNQNARNIADEAGKLLEKLAGFVADLDAVGAQLTRAQASFGTARAKLATGHGNILGRAEKIRRMGVEVKTDRARALLATGADEESDRDGDVPPAAGTPALVEDG